MSNPIDVGSVLGGRYKVTATVLTSHDRDLVLDGVDQVLNRPVSILVAGPQNTEQVAQSAREVATGERPGTVQVLDLGVSDAATYLVTNHTSAADLLDLVVAANPPYVEPFFTDTLGSEIFGQARSHEPEPYDEEENVDAGYINYSDSHPRQVDPYPARPASPVVPAAPRKPPARPVTAPGSANRSAGASAIGGAAAAGAGVGAAGAAAGGVAPRSDNSGDPQATAAHTVQPGSGNPKVSLWSDQDYEQPATPYGSDDADSLEREPEPAGRKSGVFARSSAAAAAAASFARRDSDQDDFDDRNNNEREPRSMRWLVGGLLAVVLVVGLVFAVSNLGRLFSSGPQASATDPASASSTPDASAPPTQEPNPAPAAAPPVIEDVTRQGDFDFAATFDGDLVKAFDGNAASFWSDMEFATQEWGGLAPEGVPLIVKLESPATVSSVTLTQLGGSGGSITVHTNDRPSLDGAKSVGTNSFTSTDLTMPLAEPVEAQYVIVSIKSLPKLAAPKTRYGYGIRLAEIKVQ